MKTKQAWFLLAAVAIAVAVYVVSVGHFQRDSELQQQTFGIGAPPADRLEIEAQIMKVEPVKDSFQVRFAFKPFGKYAADEFGRFASDMDVVLATSDAYRSIHLPAHQISSTVFEEVELDEGSPNYYPLDRYTAKLGIAAFVHAKGSAGPTPVATVVHYEEDLGNFKISAKLGPESTPASVDVQLAIARSAAILTFSSMMYGVIAFVSLAVLILSLLVVVRRVDSEFPMVLWSGAMLFALPAVRNSLPDSPPLGIQADFYIFMWAEFVVAVSMLTLTGHLLAKRARGEPPKPA